MTMIDGRRTTRTLAACVAVIGLLAGCGGGQGNGATAGRAAIADKTPFEVARQAPDVTRAAGTARIAFEMQYSTTGGAAIPGGSEPLIMSGTGTYDFAGQIGDGQFDSSGGGLPTERLDVVYRNNVLYQRPIGATRWQKWDFSDLVNTPVGQHDPSQQLDLLRGVSDEVREAGTTQLRGAEVRHYAITIDPKRLAEHSGVVVEGGLTELALRAAGPIPADVFVDDDGRVRKLEVNMSVAGADLAASPELAELSGSPGFAEALREMRTEMAMVIEYFDFGIPVNVQEPDPATVDSGPSFPSAPR